MVGTHMFFSVVTVLIFSGCIDSFISEWTSIQSGFTKWDRIQDVVSFSKQKAKAQFRTQTNYSSEKNVSVCNDDNHCPKNEECQRNDDSRNGFCECKAHFVRFNYVSCIECPKNCSTGESCSFGADGRPVCLCLPGYVRNGSSCQECTCRENEICSFNENGEKVCQCFPGFVKNREKCQECRCGENQECSFRSGEKVCSCREGYLKQNNICIDCGCMIDSNEECFLSADNGTECRCKKNYVSHLGKCQECHCEVEDAECSFNREGLKECKCLEGYIETEERCEANPDVPTTDDALLQITTDCECKKDSNEECFLNDDNETECRCKKNYVSFLGTCQECLCKDENSICSFNADGLAVCSCLDGYIEIGKKCEVIPDATTTEDLREIVITTDCNCDVNQICEFVEDGLQVCRCAPGFVENEGKCEECTCGENAECSFNMGTRTCSCKEGHLELNNICTECTCGENEECSFHMGKKTCSCKGPYLKINNTCTDCGCEIDLHEECIRNDSGGVSCRCKSGYAVFHNKVCVECECPDEKALCSFDEKDIPVCKCPDEYIQTGDTCTAEISTSTTDDKVIITTKETEKSTSSAEIVSSTTEEEEKSSAHTEIMTSATEETEKNTSHTKFLTSTTGAEKSTSSAEIVTSTTEETVKTTRHTKFLTSTTVETGKTTTHTEVTASTTAETIFATTEAEVVKSTEGTRTSSPHDEDVTTTEVTDPCGDLCARFACNPCKPNDTCEQEDTNYRCTCIHHSDETCGKVSCKTKHCAEGNCTELSETEFTINPTEFLCSCQKFNASYGCQRDLSTAEADSKMLSTIAASVTAAGVLILIIVFSGLKFKRRCKRSQDPYFLEDTSSCGSHSNCDFRIPTPREIPDIL